MPYLANAELVRVRTSAEEPHIIAHFPPSWGSLGFCDLSTWASSCSKALVTFWLWRALASVKEQLNLSASFLPSSALTCRCSGRRSLLLPTMTSGIHSTPYF